MTSIFRFVQRAWRSDAVAFAVVTALAIGLWVLFLVWPPNLGGQFPDFPR
jgi:hypothetical protein